MREVEFGGMGDDGVANERTRDNAEAILALVSLIRDRLSKASPVDKQSLAWLGQIATIVES